MNKKKIFTMYFLILFLSLSTFTIAQNNSPDNTTPPTRDSVIDTAKQKKDEVDSRKEDALAYKCSTSSSKMDIVEANYRNNFNKHQERYTNMIGRINELLDTLESQDYDVSSAREKNLAFQAQVEATRSDFDSFSFEFQQAKGLLCEDDISGFRESLNQSRNQLKVIRNNMLKLRSEYQNSVKPELLALREQVRERSQEDLVNEVNE